MLTSTLPMQKKISTQGTSQPIPEPTGRFIPRPVREPTPQSLATQMPHPIIAQTKRNIDAGQVAADMRTTPGLNAALRARLVHGTAGKNRTSGG